MHAVLPRVDASAVCSLEIVLGDLREVGGYLAEKRQSGAYFPARRLYLEEDRQLDLTLLGKRQDELLEYLFCGKKIQRGDGDDKALTPRSNSVCQGPLCQLRSNSSSLPPYSGSPGSATQVWGRSGGRKSGG